MRYKILIFGIIFLACVIVLMEVDKEIRAKILSVSDYVKIFVINLQENISNAYNKHFNQAETIARLDKQVRDYERVYLQMQSLKTDNIKLNEFIANSNIAHKSMEIYPARIIGFADLRQRDKVWLQADTNKQEHNDALERRIFGIVKDNVALGIAIIRNGRVEGLLNGHPQCSYDVYVGEDRALGIVSGSSNGDLFVDYISNLSNIKEGDKVFTSGLDGIFLEHIPVGIVKNVHNNYSHLSADVEPYGAVDSLSYVWLIDRESHKSPFENKASQPDSKDIQHQSQPSTNTESNNVLDEQPTQMLP